MKIRFVQPPYEIDENWGTEVPIGILSLATILNELGYAVEIVDLQLEKPKLLPKDDTLYKTLAARLLDDSTVDILGFSVMSCAFPETLLIAEECKKLNSKIIIIFGGSQPTLIPEEILKTFSFIDYVYRGEAETNIVNLVKAVRGKYDLPLIQGLTYRDHQDKVISNPDQELIQNLDQLPILNYSLLPSEYFYFADQSVSVDVGRGCPFQCTFCSTRIIWRCKFRMKSPQRIISEMRNLHKRHGVVHFNLQHDLFTFNHKFVEEFCDLIVQSGLDVNWVCSSRVSTIDSPLLKKMSSSGCETIFYGIESGSDRILKAMNKKTSKKQIHHTILETGKTQIKGIYSFILGMPEETAADLNESLQIAIFSKVNNGIVALVNQLRPEPVTSVLLENVDKLYFDIKITKDECLVGKESQKVIDLIHQYPELFSYFYFIKTDNLSINQYTEIANNCHYIINYFANTLYHLCFNLNYSFLENIYFEYKGCFSQEMTQKQRFILEKEMILSSFSTFIQTKYASSPLLTNLVRYEELNATTIESNKSPELKSELSLDEIPELQQNIKVAHFDYNVIGLTKNIQNLSSIDIPKEDMYLLFKYNHHRKVDITQLDQFTYQILKKCSGEKNILQLITEFKDYPQQLLETLVFCYNHDYIFIK